MTTSPATTVAPDWPSEPPHLPCPAWCSIRQTDHDFTTMDKATGELFRYHELTVTPYIESTVYPVVRLTATERFVAGQHHVLDATQVSIDELDRDEFETPVVSPRELLDLANDLRRAAEIVARTEGIRDVRAEQVGAIYDEGYRDGQEDRQRRAPGLTS